MLAQNATGVCSVCSVQRYCTRTVHVQCLYVPCWEAKSGGVCAAWYQRSAGLRLLLVMQMHHMTLGSWGDHEYPSCFLVPSKNDTFDVNRRANAQQSCRIFRSQPAAPVVITRGPWCVRVFWLCGWARRDSKRLDREGRTHGASGAVDYCAFDGTRKGSPACRGRRRHRAAVW